MSAPANVERLRDALAELRANALEQEERLASELALLHPSHRAAGRNLAHYLALRQHDLRELQRELAALGLSSLGRSERCVLATLNAVERALSGLAGDRTPRTPLVDPPTSFESADAALEACAQAVLGPLPPGRTARILVTLPEDPDCATIERLLAEGADAVRINCAKGNSDSWSRTVEWVQLAARRRGRECRILCDLAGPNPRTSELAPSPRDVLGVVRVGDRLRLASADAARAHADEPIAIGCTLPSILGDLQPGERVFYDDGKLGGVVRQVGPEGALVEVTFARKGRVKLRAKKGLNFPDSKLRLPSLTPKDLEDLQFIARHADMVGLSFVRGPEHVDALQRELNRLAAPELALVLKIETTAAFESLPRLLLTALRSQNVGIMVARGDMAIEMGFARLAEAQEEVLWLSEAAFVPVIWATQVLDALNKTGMPSRAEVTDAAMAGRAECVMLNQGSHLPETLRFLRNVLERMQEHQDKKRSLLRRLKISDLS